MKKSKRDKEGCKETRGEKEKIYRKR